MKRGSVTNRTSGGSLPRLTVFGRAYCHLCHDMVAELTRINQDRHFEMTVVDIEDDPVLEAKYGHLVPVLVGEEKEICHYFLDHAALAMFLDSFSAAGKVMASAGNDS